MSPAPSSSSRRSPARVLAVSAVTVALLSAGGYALSAQAASTPTPVPTRTATVAPSQPKVSASATRTADVSQPKVSATTDPSEAGPAKPVSRRPDFTG